MFIQQLYTDCLSEAAYYVESEGEAAIIDPLRDTAAYTRLAEERGATIRYIFETHFHADFVSGHLDLAKKTGAPIIYGPGTATRFPVHVAREKEVFVLGAVTLEVWHTPGHTLESSCYLLRDASHAPYCLFTGDTLFVGEVGRPDLSSGNKSKEALASLLFDSLQKLKTLPDTLILYPAHGPGSACGKHLGQDTTSTLGREKKENYALQYSSREEFIDAVVTGLEDPPEYFKTSARINQQGYTDLEQILVQSHRALSVAVFNKEAKKGALILDTRPPEDFARGFVPGSINIGLKGRFAEWVGTLVPYDQTVILVTAPGEEEQTIIRMARVGFDRVAGYLQGGYAAWTKAGQMQDLIVTVDPEELAIDLPYDKKMQVIDVRRPAEYAAGHLQDAVNIPLNTLADPAVLASLDDSRNIYVYCQSGYRGVIACALWKRAGKHNLRHVEGGFAQMGEVAALPVILEKVTLS
jgi:glyoxylase-like metal-dependent hydrolase (beta-lactamase superfamily II)/rhodanese-related sulfurtransferase